MMNLPSAYGYALRVLVTAMMLMLLSESALAESPRFQLEYVRKDVSAANLTRGTVLGTIYLVSQDLEVQTQGHRAGNYIGNILIGGYPVKTTPDPGCQILNGDNSIGMLRYTGTVTETVCDPNKSYDAFITSVIARDTGKTVYYKATGTWYVYKVSLPRTKMADVIVNDPVKALSHAGQNLTITTYDLAGIRFTTVLDRFEASSPASTVSVHIGETPAAAFFPEQNTSNAFLTLPVRPSGGNQSGMASGSTSIDLCLYDGAGLSKSRYALTFLDENTTNTSRDFGVYRERGAGEIVYKVSLTNPAGTPQEVYNRQPFYWDNMQNGGAAQSRLRYVQLPNSSIQGTVPCVPSTVTLKVSPVPYNSLPAGRFTGKVSILFTPSTTD